MRVVLDTNVLVSALILRGKTSELVNLWREGRIIPVLTRDTFIEFRRVLQYPKFSLSEGEIENIVQREVLPFFEVVEPVATVSGACRDPDDDKFLACAVSAKVSFLVSGDMDLCSLTEFRGIRIVTPDQILAVLCKTD